MTLTLGLNNVFSCECISSLTIALSNWCIGHMLWTVLVNIFLENASPKLLDVATSDLARE